MLILQALDILVKEQNRYHFHLNIFGDGDEVYIRELEAFLQQKQLVQYVTFHGKVPQDELIKHYDRSDIMLVPSIWKEPFGLVVAEAMARGLPIIASNLGGPTEIVTQDVDGLLIEPGNVQALIGAGTRVRPYAFSTSVVAAGTALFRSISAVLSPKLERSSKPTLWSTLSIAFASGVPSAARTCTPPFSAPPACPARKNGTRLWLWRFESPIGEP